ncbi:hypothetical protein EcWSU1_02468 [Enterobacter ludwigii]|uniref:Uncharacterized protein n=1 Tax=Enterobacter ludwigii TaxID=299767 RepID=G8LDP2_9ENTR|nr:hypothetical protein EcWSU1_02468 [Enterobacter ludwigii]
MMYWNFSRIEVGKKAWFCVAIFIDALLSLKSDAHLDAQFRMQIDILHVALSAGGKSDNRVNQIFAVQITVHQQFPAGLFNTLAAPARVIRVRFAAGARENDFRVIEVGFAPQIEPFCERFRESHVGDRSTVGEPAQRRLQCIGKTAGFDNHVSALLSGQFFNLQTDIGAKRIEAVIGPVTAGNFAAMFDRVDTDDDGCTGFFRQLNRNLPNGTQSDHNDKIPHPHVSITHAAHGELRRVVTDSIFPGRPLRHFAQLVVINGIHDDRLLQRPIAADTVARLVLRHVIAAFDNVANDHVAQLELTKLNAPRRALFTRGKHLPLRVKLLINEGTCRTEIYHFGAVFWRAEARTNFHFMDGNRTIFIFHQRRYTRRCRN